MEKVQGSIGHIFENVLFSGTKSGTPNLEKDRRSSVESLEYISKMFFERQIRV